MKTKCLALILALLASACDSRPKAISPAKRAERRAKIQQETLSQKSESALLKHLTNDVVGLRAVIATYLPAGTNLTGSAVVEFVNAAGGVERAEKFYTFKTKFGEGDDCYVVVEKDFERQAKADFAKRK